MKPKSKTDFRQGLLLLLFIVLASAATLGDVAAQITLVDVGYATDTNNGGTASGIVVSNGYAYLANGADGLCVFDVSNPTNPVLTGHAIANGPADALALSGGFAYVASGTNGLEIFSVSNVTRVVPVGHISSGVAFSTAGGVAVSGNYVYLADSTAGLCVFDVSTPSAPVKVAEINEGEANNVFVSGNYLYVSCGGFVPPGQYVTNALVVNDISNPTNPVVIAHAPGSKGGGAGLAVTGNLLYLAQKTISEIIGSGGLSVFDISNPAAPQYLGNVRLADASAVKVLGDYVFFAANLNGLIVYDTTGGTNLVNVGRVINGANLGSCVDVAISGSYAYVANGPDGLRVCAMVPQLTMQVTQPNSVNFSWLSPGSCALQQNPDPTSTNWTTLTNIPVAIGPTNQVTILAPEGNMFYRLVSQ